MDLALTDQFKVTLQVREHLREQHRMPRWGCFIPQYSLLHERAAALTAESDYNISA